jgi:hypothetical protein
MSIAIDPDSLTPSLIVLEALHTVSTAVSIEQVAFA